MPDSEISRLSAAIFFSLLNYDMTFIENQSGNSVFYNHVNINSNIVKIGE